MKSEKGEKGKPARRPGVRRGRSSKPRSMRGISPSRASSLSIQPQDVSLTRMLETLKPHDHLCLIYESQEEWRAAAVPFISIGLRRGEKCIYIVDTSTADEIRKYLSEEGVDVASAEKTGQLVVLHETEAYTREGSFDPDRMIALLISETAKAIAEGYPALRTTGEMTWVLRGHPGSEKLLEYEAKLNSDFFPKYSCLAVCQYDRWRFDPEIIKGVIMTHPLLVRGNHIYRNFYYIPTEEFLNAKRAEVEAQHWLNNVEREQQILQTLRESEEYFRALIENSSDVVTVIDSLGTVQYQSPNYRTVWGRDPNGEIGRDLFKDVHPDDVALVGERFSSILMNPGGTVNIEVRAKHQDGSWRTIDVVGRNLLDHPAVRGIVVNFRDITERKRAEEALQKSREALQKTFESVTDGISVIDLNGVIIETNQRTVEIHGFSSKDELLGKSALELIAPRDREKIVKNMWQAIKQGTIRDVEYNLLRADGSEFPGELSTSVLNDASGNVVGHVTIARDVTQRKQAEEEKGQFEQKAQIASRLTSVGEMAAGIAHEINNPLTSVIGYSQLLSGREDIPEDVKMDLKAIDEGAQRVAGIIKRLLTFARQSRPERTLVSINDIITNTLDLRAYHLRTNNIKVTAKLATDLPLTTADPAQLQQVFLNIIVNAEAEMRQASGRVKLLVKTEEVNGTIRISFKDNGPGIAKKNLVRIFDPFFTTREVGQGTGLGLSICHGIIVEHKGRIWAESKPGRGATFIVELPIVMESRQLEMAESPGKKLKKVLKAKILVVDDEPSTLEFLSRLLTDEGHDVETVNDADEALEMVKNKRYSLILLDIKMPGTSGIELYGRMQKIALSLAERVIFITGDVMGTDTEAFLSKTKAPYITKPFDVHQLKKKIERFLTGD